jgi:hypothetical protein
MLSVRLTMLVKASRGETLLLIGRDVKVEGRAGGHVPSTSGTLSDSHLTVYVASSGHTLAVVQVSRARIAGLKACALRASSALCDGERLPTGGHEG